MNSRRVAQDEATLHDLLACVDSGGRMNQRSLAHDLGIALGLTNAYVRRCVDGGFVEMRDQPGRGCRYVLTPAGAEEKKRLAERQAESAFDLFRRARDSFDGLYAGLAGRGVASVVLCGTDDLTEIAILCSIGSPLTVSGIWRHAGRPTALRDIPPVTMETLAGAEAAVLAVRRNAASVYHALCRVMPADRIAVPDLLADVAPAAGA